MRIPLFYQVFLLSLATLAVSALGGCFNYGTATDVLFEHEREDLRDESQVLATELANIILFGVYQTNQLEVRLRQLNHSVGHQPGNGLDTARDAALDHGHDSGLEKAFAQLETFFQEAAEAHRRAGASENRSDGVIRGIRYWANDTGRVLEVCDDEGSGRTRKRSIREGQAMPAGGIHVLDRQLAVTSAFAVEGAPRAVQLRIDIPEFRRRLEEAPRHEGILLDDQNRRVLGSWTEDEWRRLMEARQPSLAGPRSLPTASLAATQAREDSLSPVPFIIRLHGQLPQHWFCVMPLERFRGMDLEARFNELKEVKASAAGPSFDTVRHPRVDISTQRVVFAARSRDELTRWLDALGFAASRLPEFPLAPFVSVKSTSNLHAWSFRVPLPAMEGSLAATGSPAAGSPAAGSPAAGRWFTLVRAASAEEMRADIDRDLWQKATIAVGLSVLFAAMISFFGNLQIVKPLLLLKRRVKEGDAKIDRHITFSREVSELADAFEKSFQEIKDQKKKLDLGKEELERQVRERTLQLESSNSELTKSKLELQQNQRLREIFIGQINHDIRNPLQIIGGCVRRLRRARAPEQYVAELEQAGGRIHRLVDDLRDYQVILNGAADPRLREFDPRDLFDEVKREFAAKAEANRVQLTFTVEDDVPTMLSDRDWLLRIVANLVSNACKFTRDGTIRCRMWLDTDDGCRSVCIEVADSGRGMSPEEQAKLFVPYEKIASVEENPDGTGLGLVICKEYCKRLQGGIRVVPERTALGRGTTFLVRVAARLAPNARLAPTARTVPRQSLTQAEASRTDRERPLALVVDDEAEICRLIGEHLSQLGFDVITAQDGVKALELARDRLPDLVTLDIQIPLLDGWHVLRELKAAAATTKAIPVVLVTVQDNLTKGFTLGAADFLGKPIDFDHFEAVVSQFRPMPNEGSILLVDDELELRQSLAAELGNRGWRVVDAADGIEALERLRAGFRPDVVLLDLLMPRMNGFEFAREVRNDTAFRDIPIIVLTGQQLTPADRDRFGGCVQRIIEKQSLAWSELLDQISTAARRIQSQRGR